jgi:hypothetical protein
VLLGAEVSLVSPRAATGGIQYTTMNRLNHHTERMIIKKHDGLLAQARRIFGEKMVAAAWIADVAIDIGRTRKDLETQWNEWEDDATCALDIGCRRFIIEFNNGRKVEFHSSEWGAVELTDKELIELS